MATQLRERTAPFTALQGHPFMSLTSFRRDGTPIATPVWFAQEADRLFVMTLSTSGKVKRIRNNAQVEVAPCDVRGNVLGETHEGMARLLSRKSDEAAYANRVLNAKYGLQKRLFDLFGLVRRGEYVFIEITPM